jgi:type I restriction enzyme, S subunit
MKTIKSLTEAELAELSKLPEEWKWARLGELVHDIVVGYVGPITQFLTDDTTNGIRFLSTTHIGDKQFLNHKENRYVTNEFSMKNKKSEVLAGDIIVARHGDSGKCCIIPPYIKKAQVSNAVIIRPNNELFINLYIVYSFEYLKQSLQKKKIGGVQQVVNTKTMDVFPFPLPPLPEQRAIVSKIEFLFSELDNGIANLKLGQEQLKVYRQAVLKKAFEGELTKKWREQQTNLPDAGDLLEQIRKEREEDAKISGEKLKKVKYLPETEVFELSKLPEKWIWLRVEETSSHVVDCLHSTAKFVDCGFYCIDTTCIENGKILYEKARFVDEETYQDRIRRLKPESGDILFAREGTVGTTVITPENVNLCLGQRMMMFRPLQKITPRFFMYYFQSTLFSKQYKPLIGGTTSPHLNIRDIIQLKFPLCSIPEQQAIVQEIETRLSVCDKVEQDIEENLIRAEALRQSILKKAFEGKLLNEKELAEVRMAEDWEPAEVLLERIRAERVGK